MWPCSDSDRPSRPAAMVMAFVLLAAPFFAMVAPATAAVEATVDSAGETLQFDSDHGPEVEIGPGGVKIRVDAKDEIVRVHGPVISVDSDDAGRVRVFSDAIVEEGEHVDGDVVAVFGSVEVDGTVDGSVVSVFGSVILGDRADVRDDAVAVGGVLEMAQDARVGGETVSVGFLPISWGVPTLPFLLATIVLGLLLSVMIGWVLFVAAPDRMRRTAVTIADRTWASLLVGLIAPPVVIITIGLLFITVIGIPGAFLLPILYGGLLWAGQIAAAYVLGCKLTSRGIGGGPMLPLFAGLVFVGMFFMIGAVLATPPGFTRSMALFFSLLGVLLMVVLSAIGSGALILSRLGSRGEGAVADDTPQPGVESDPPGGGTPAVRRDADTGPATSPTA